MRSENSLRKSYETQKRIFEESKIRKEENRKKQLEILENKIRTLENQRQLLLTSLENEEFPSFEDFLQQSRRQSKESKGSQSLS